MKTWHSKQQEALCFREHGFRKLHTLNRTKGQEYIGTDDDEDRNAAPFEVDSDGDNDQTYDGIPLEG